MDERLRVATFSHSTSTTPLPDTLDYGTMSSNRPNGPNSDALLGQGGRRPNPTNKQPSETNLTPGGNALYPRIAYNAVVAKQ